MTLIGSNSKPLMIRDWNTYVKWSTLLRRWTPEILVINTASNNTLFIALFITLNAPPHPRISLRTFWITAFIMCYLENSQGISLKGSLGSIGNKLEEKFTFLLIKCCPGCTYNLNCLRNY